MKNTKYYEKYEIIWNNMKYEKIRNYTKEYKIWKNKKKFK